MSARVPSEAIAYLDAVRRFYQPGVTRTPRNADIAAAHRPRLEGRTWDRRKADLRSGKYGGRDWIEVWPPQPDWHPTWEPMLIVASGPRQLTLPEASDDGLVHMVIDEVYDLKGNLVAKRVIRQIGHLGTAAAMFYTVLDIIDGHLDGVVRAACVGHQLLGPALRAIGVHA